MSELTHHSVGEAPPGDDSLADFLGKQLGTEVPAGCSFELVPYSNAGGLSAEMRRLQVTCPDGNKLLFVYKATFPDREGMSKQLGIMREAMFYEHFAPLFQTAGVRIPKVYYCHGSLTTGLKAVLMEDLSPTCVQSGYYFGPHSPLNWGKDLPALIARDGRDANPPSAREVADITFRMIAHVHAAFWRNDALRQHTSLRGVDWLQGDGREAWEAAQAHSRGTWAAAKAKIEDGSTQIKWNDNLVACMDASVGRISWETFQRDLQSRAWSLVHGDFHPANVMWHEATQHKGQERGFPILLDWEMVGLGNGPQDIAQYLISHVPPAEQREYGSELLRHYYDTLTNGTGRICSTATVGGASTSGESISGEAYSWEQCQHDFAQGGACRWVWLFAFLTSICPPPLVQYFHDQLAAFLEDHGLNKDNIGMPRV